MGVVGRGAGSFGEARETAAQHLAHHGEIVVPGGGADVELAILALLEAARAGDDHAADRFGALNVAVVVNLDAARGRGEAEHLGDAFQKLGLGGAFSLTTAQRLAGVEPRLIDDLALLAALGDGHLDAAALADGERLGQQSAAGRIVGQEDQAGRLAALVELGEEGVEHLVDRRAAIVTGKIGAVAPVLAAAEEEDLNAGFAVRAMDREDVGFLEALRVDPLRLLDMGERLDPVAQAGGSLEIERFSRLLHAGAQRLADRAAAARQESLGVVHEGHVAGVVDAADARGAAPLDLIEQAGTGAGLEHRIRAGAQQEGALERVERAAHRAGRGEGAEIIAFPRARAAMFHHLREGVVARQQDVGEGFVVAQQHVVARPVALDEIGFEEEGLRLGRRLHEGHIYGGHDHAGDAVRVARALGVVRHALLQIARLAHVNDVSVTVDHAVNAGRVRQAAHLFRDQFRARNGGRFVCLHT